ncbi:hypothetical protein AAE478_009304 [Parahypoxylon ruwenzoriense]
MCVLAKTLCPECGLLDNGFGIYLCDNIANQHFSDDVEYSVQHGFRFHCPDFLWPVPKLSVQYEYCEECATKNISHSHKAPKTTLVCERKVCEGELKLKFKRENVQNHWMARLSEKPHRLLTLRIPCCNLCKKPTFFMNNNRKKGGDIPEGGIEGIELEPNSILQKWMFLLREPWQESQAISTRIQTGFITKPCSTCINLETVLRGKVLQFVQKCEPVEAWAVWNWLSLRGSGQVNFWHHEMRNVGLPGIAPPHLIYFKSLMADGWRARTGVAWEEIVDFGPPTQCPLPLTIHREPFINLSQWNRFLGIFGESDPIIQPPPAPLDIEHIAIKDELLNRVPRPSPTPTSDILSPRKQAMRHPKNHNDGQLGTSSLMHDQLPVQGVMNSQNHPTSSHKRVHFEDQTTPLAKKLNDMVNHGVDELFLDWDELGQDSDDLFGDKDVVETEVLAVKPFVNGGEKASPDDHHSEAETNEPSEDSDVEMGNSSQEDADANLGEFERCEFDYWHLSGVRNSVACWALPLGVSPNESAPVEDDEQTINGESANEESANEESADGEPVNDQLDWLIGQPRWHGQVPDKQRNYDRIEAEARDLIPAGLTRRDSIVP